PGWLLVINAVKLLAPRTPPQTSKAVGRRHAMPKKNSSGTHGVLNAEPRVQQRARQIQPYGTVTHAIHLDLEAPVRLEMTAHPNPLLADSMSLRDLYTPAPW